ncbi:MULTISPECIES: hypothetical protein [unclassified Thioalkalivibrio]|uniref:hypothetical protein n=1 Tax=unclassified Thioalkalivibrio TaxID=2621013 RepID=UPI000370762E|nr:MULTISPECIES: hypothetical protein [unclassified Thioalkalivibrio]
MQFVLIAAVIPRSLADRAIEIVQRDGAAGLTLLDAQGIAQLRRNPVMDLKDTSGRKVLLMVLESSLARRMLDHLDAELELSRLGNGFAVTLPIKDIAGIKPEQIEHLRKTLGKH